MRSISVSIGQSNLIQFEGKDRDFILFSTVSPALGA